MSLCCRFKYRIIIVLCGVLIAILLLCILRITEKSDYIYIFHEYSISIPKPKNNIGREAIVSILTGDLYLPAILVLGYSLKKSNSINNRDMIVIIPIGAIPDQRHLQMLYAIGWKVIYVKRLSFPDKVTPQLVDCLVKLYAWNMTQYDIIATLDADLMIINSIEEPFQQMRMNSTIQMLAVDDAGIPMSYRKELRSYFNSGVLFFRPNAKHFDDLVRLSSNKSFYDLTYPQQNLLNKYFHDQWDPLPSAFNMLDHLNGKHFNWPNRTDNLHVIHFAGTHKPWERLHKLRDRKLDADIIWRRFFAALVTDHGWKKKDFLGSGASMLLRRNLRYDEWTTAV